MSAHTPGPWEAQRQDRVLTGPHRERYANWFVTAEGPSEEEGTHICSIQADDTGPRTASNAHLIAAAPELLAACHAALDSKAVVLGDRELIEVMKAAIAKAEGRS
jgi:hypothetical protein